MPTKAMVLAAGLGTRMRPLTDTMPKPLVTVAGIPLIDHALNWLADGGITDTVVNSFYMAEKLEGYLLGREHPRIHISREDTLLETGGGIKKALPFLGETPFFSLNSDTICVNAKASALTRMADAWTDGIDALLLLHPTSTAIGYAGKGDFFLEGGKLRRRSADESANYVFTGVQLIHPRMFKNSPGGAFSMNVLYNHGMEHDGTLHRIGAIVHDGNWLHIGTPGERDIADAWFAAN